MSTPSKPLPLSVAKAKPRRPRTAKPASKPPVVPASDVFASETAAEAANGAEDDSAEHSEVSAAAAPKKRGTLRRRACAGDAEVETRDTKVPTLRRHSKVDPSGVEYTQLEQQVVAIRAAHPDLVLLVEVTPRLPSLCLALLRRPDLCRG